MSTADYGFADVLEEAERITAQAAAQAEVDRRRREWDAAVEDYCMRFGFDYPEAVES